MCKVSFVKYVLYNVDHAHRIYCLSIDELSSLFIVLCTQYRIYADLIKLYNC